MWSASLSVLLIAFCAAAQISSFVYPHKSQPFVCTHKWALRLPRFCVAFRFQEVFCAFRFHCNWKNFEDADHDQVREFVIGQPVSERALLARTNHSILILHSSCPSAAVVCRRLCSCALVRISYFFAPPHLWHFMLPIWHKVRFRISLQAFAVACYWGQVQSDYRVFDSWRRTR